MITRRKQGGLSIWELLFFSALVGVTALIVMKLLPLYLEKFKVVKAMKSIAEQPTVRNMDENEIVKALLKHFEIEDVDKFSSPNDLKKIFDVVKNKDNEGRTMSMKYEIRAPFVSDLDVVLKVDNVVPIAAFSPN